MLRNTDCLMDQALSAHCVALVPSLVPMRVRGEGGVRPLGPLVRVAEGRGHPAIENQESQALAPPHLCADRVASPPCAPTPPPGQSRRFHLPFFGAAQF